MTNTITEKLLQESKKTDGLRWLKTRLQELRSRQENDYYDYYYGDIHFDNECNSVTERWEKDGKLLESYKEVFDWNEKFRYVIHWNVSAFDTYPTPSRWTEDKQSVNEIAQKQFGVVREIEESEAYKEFNVFENFDEDEINLYNEKKRKLEVSVDDFKLK